MEKDTVILNALILIGIGAFLVILGVNCCEKYSIQYDFSEELPAEAYIFEDDIVIDIDIEKCLKSNFYNMNDEDNSSVLSKRLLKAFEVNNYFYYCGTINGNICLVYIKKVGDEYLELIYDNKNRKYAFLKFNTLEKKIEKGVCSDNIERETTKYYLLSENAKQYIGKSVVVISESETIDLLKKYKHDIEGAQLDITDDINSIMKENYTGTYGLQNDVKFIMYQNKNILLCTINIHPDGYCFTSYNPTTDKFDVKIYKYLYIVYEDNKYKCYLTDIKINDLSSISKLEDNNQAVLIE